MPAQKIVPIVEGDGEVSAAPALLARVLHHHKAYDLFVGDAINAHGRGNLTRPDGLERFLKVAYHRPDCAAVLVLLDSERDCPLTLAQEFVRRVLACGPRRPTAIVFAHPMYEVWMVASAATLAGKGPCEGVVFRDDLAPPAETEKLADPKAWVARQLPRNRGYKETADQVALTRLIDLELAATNSRSFRRLLKAVSELIASVQAAENSVTPQVIKPQEARNNQRPGQVR